MHKCPRCQDREVERGYCPPCRRQYDNAYHHRTKSVRGERKYKLQKERIHRAAALVAEYKEARGCVDCKQRYKSYVLVLDLDHINEDKLDNVSSLVLGGASIEKITREIEKCEVVCANCHRVRTHEHRHET